MERFTFALRFLTNRLKQLSLNSHRGGRSQIGFSSLHSRDFILCFVVISTTRRLSSRKTLVSGLYGIFENLWKKRPPFDTAGPFKDSLSEAARHRSR